MVGGKTAVGKKTLLKTTYRVGNVVEGAKTTVAEGAKQTLQKGAEMGKAVMRALSPKGSPRALLSAKKAPQTQAPVEEQTTHAHRGNASPDKQVVQYSPGKPKSSGRTGVSSSVKNGDEQASRSTALAPNSGAKNEDHSLHEIQLDVEDLPEEQEPPRRRRLKSVLDVASQKRGRRKSPLLLRPGESLPTGAAMSSSSSPGKKQNQQEGQHGHFQTLESSEASYSLLGTSADVITSGSEDFAWVPQRRSRKARGRGPSDSGSKESTESGLSAKLAAVTVLAEEEGGARAPGTGPSASHTHSLTPSGSHHGLPPVVDVVEDGSSSFGGGTTTNSSKSSALSVGTSSSVTSTSSVTSSGSRKVTPNMIRNPVLRAVLAKESAKETAAKLDSSLDADLDLSPLVVRPTVPPPSGRSGGDTSGRVDAPLGSSAVIGGPVENTAPVVSPSRADRVRRTTLAANQYLQSGALKKPEATTKTTNPVVKNPMPRLQKRAPAGGPPLSGSRQQGDGDDALPNPYTLDGGLGGDCVGSAESAHSSALAEECYRCFVDGRRPEIATLEQLAKSSDPQTNFRGKTALEWLEHGGYQNSEQATRYRRWFAQQGAVPRGGVVGRDDSSSSRFGPSSVQEMEDDDHKPARLVEAAGRKPQLLQHTPDQKSKKQIAANRSTDFSLSSSADQTSLVARQLANGGPKKPVPYLKKNSGNSAGRNPSSGRKPSADRQRGGGSHHTSSGGVRSAGRTGAHHQHATSAEFDTSISSISSVNSGTGALDQVRRKQQILSSSSSSASAAKHAAARGAKKSGSSSRGVVSSRRGVAPVDHDTKEEGEEMWF